MLKAVRMLSAVAALYILVAGAPLGAQGGPGSNVHWVGTWATAVVPRPQAAPGAVRGPALADLAIDLLLPGDTANSPSPLTTHNGSLQTSYIAAAGNHAGEGEWASPATLQSWFFLSAVEVAAPDNAGAVVVFGDSITD